MKERILAFSAAFMLFAAVTGCQEKESTQQLTDPESIRSASLARGTTPTLVKEPKAIDVGQFQVGGDTLDTPLYLCDENILRSRSEADSSGCCSILSLKYVEPPQWQPQVLSWIAAPTYPGATNWLLRHTLVDNSTGATVMDQFATDVSFPMSPACYQTIQVASPVLGYVSKFCANDFTYTLARYFDWSGSGILRRCCSKSIQLKLPVDPEHETPCG